MCPHVQVLPCNQVSSAHAGFVCDPVPQYPRGYKTHMLGNIKLVGGLLSRGMLASKAPTHRNRALGVLGACKPKARNSSGGGKNTAERAMVVLIVLVVLGLILVVLFVEVVVVVAVVTKGVCFWVATDNFSAFRLSLREFLILSSFRGFLNVISVPIAVSVASLDLPLLLTILVRFTGIFWVCFSDFLILRVSIFGL